MTRRKKPRKVKMKYIPKHKRAPLIKNRRGFRAMEGHYKMGRLIREGYDLPSRHLSAR